MEIIYQLKDQDFLEGMQFMRKISRDVKRITIAGVAILASLPVLNFFIHGKFTAYYLFQMFGEIVILSTLNLIFTQIASPLIYRVSLSTLKQQKHNGVLGERKICITNEEILETISVNESRVKWNGIEGVYINRTYIIIMITSQKGHIIPKKAFDSAEASVEFYNQALNYHASSQSGI